jgi:hypothetical protein|tara:strand:- start:319 stop:960 length:642 start_codon:yes stop_codon:yes gene_type:complete
MAIGILGGIASGLGGAIMGGMARSRARSRQKKLLKDIKELEENRQDIIDPFEGIEDILTNPFANLTVANQAAQMQAQQTDLSLASTLDTLRATGAGAGGATALAQAALSSKQGIAASIAQQEAQNARLAAQGRARLERQLAEAEAQGRQFVFGVQEKREMQKLNRLSALAGAASQQAAAAETQMLGGIGSVLGSLGSGFENLAEGLTFTGKKK